MNLFIKTKIESILDDKLKSGEILFYKLTDKSLHIKKSRRSKTTLNIGGISAPILARLLVKRFPNPQDQNLTQFFKVELRELQICGILK
jgi:hypothetical protein